MLYSIQASCSSIKLTKDLTDLELWKDEGMDACILCTGLA